MPQTTPEACKDPAQGFTTLGLINTNSDVAKRGEYPILLVIRDHGTGRLFANDPESSHFILEVEPDDCIVLTSNSRWLHTNGSAYICHGVVTVTSDLKLTCPLLVIYEDFSTGILWGKSPKRFLQGMAKISKD